MAGRRLDMRALADLGQFWAFNGGAGIGPPLAEAAPGETLRIAMENRTAFDHAMHLHGHHFRTDPGDGRLGPWRDTMLLPAGAARDILFVAETPGDWMLHCHMLGHAKAGMTTHIRIG